MTITSKTNGTSRRTQGNALKAQHAPMLVRDANGFEVTLTAAEVKMMDNLGWTALEVLELRDNIANASRAR